MRPVPNQLHVYVSKKALRELLASRLLSNQWIDEAVASCAKKNCSGRERELKDAHARIAELEAKINMLEGVPVSEDMLDTARAEALEEITNE